MTFFKLCAVGVLWVAVPAAARAQAPDYRAEAAQIVKADADFAKSVAEKNKSAFLTFLSKFATFNGGTPNEIHGGDAVLKEWTRFFEPDGPSLSWAPTKGEVIGAGDLGYTIGRSVLRRTAPDGTVTERPGQYLTVWSKEEDGTWRVIFDTGSTLPQ